MWGSIWEYISDHKTIKRIYSIFSYTNLKSEPGNLELTHRKPGFSWRDFDSTNKNKNRGDGSPRFSEFWPEKRGDRFCPRRSIAASSSAECMLNNWCERRCDLSRYVRTVRAQWIRASRSFPSKTLPKNEHGEKAVDIYFRNVRSIWEYISDHKTGVMNTVFHAK